jgi:hypothetical protein
MCQLTSRWGQQEFEYRLQHQCFIQAFCEAHPRRVGGTLPGKGGPSAKMSAHNYCGSLQFPFMSFTSPYKGLWPQRQMCHCKRSLSVRLRYLVFSCFTLPGKGGRSAKMSAHNYCGSLQFPFMSFTSPYKGSWPQRKMCHCKRSLSVRIRYLVISCF